MSESLADFVVGLNDLEMIRLVSAAGLVILLYDHLLTLPDEVRYIWPAQLTSSKVLFLGMRYIVPWVMIGHTLQISGISHIPLPDPVCKAWYSIAIVLGWLTLGINDWLVLLRLWVLWDRNRSFIICTLLVFLVANISVLVLSIIDFVKIIPRLYFDPTIAVCVLDTSLHTFRVLWLPGLSFQCVMVLGIAWKIMARPHMSLNLIRDGYLFFLLLFASNLLNAIFVLTARPTLNLVLVFFMWCLTTTTTCRMILSLRRSSSREIAVDEDPYGEWPSSATHLELAWVCGQSTSTTRERSPTPRSGL
ncbi:hypothetical protein K438DRAFT_2015469 [Mycena galopus ATCC 62051]|nr:hypothetical protein K438DRAFT_2015469 [Mycena galopus ATCC 62051]